METLPTDLRRRAAELDGAGHINPGRVPRPKTLSDFEQLLSGRQRCQVIHYQAVGTGREPEQLEKDVGVEMFGALKHVVNQVEAISSWDGLIRILERQAEGKQLFVKFDRTTEPEYFLVTDFNEKGLSASWWSWDSVENRWLVSGGPIMHRSQQPMMFVIC